MRKNLLAPGLLALGLVLGGYLATSAQGQPVAQDGHRGWPPRPQDIVNIDDFQAPATPSPQSFPMFTVPANRWLVVTDFAVSVSTPLGQLVQALGGVETVKFTPSNVNRQGAPYAYSSPVGIVFEPSSTVAFRQAAGANITTASLTGYLTR
jgi:hypothetical protein